VKGPKLHTAGKNMQASVTTNQMMQDNLLEKRAVLDRNCRSKKPQAIIWPAGLHLFFNSSWS